MIVEPAFVTFLIVIIEQVRLEQFVHESRHAAQGLLADHRGPDAQRKLLSGLLVADILSRPGAQLLTSGLLCGRVRLLRGISGGSFALSRLGRRD